MNFSYCNNAYRPWLLVLDNANNIEIFFSNKVNPLLESSKQIVALVNYLSYSLILITTRDKQVGERLANREKSIVVLPIARLELEALL